MRGNGRYGFQDGGVLEDFTKPAAEPLQQLRRRISLRF